MNVLSGSTIVPIVSVVLPVYNCEKYISESIDSILQQSFTDFELIVIDDGSSDGTYQKIKEFDDPRIIVLSQKNKGLPCTLNESFEMARGKYIARQDADDYSFPDRLRRQVDFLENNPEIALVGTWAEIWVETEKSSRFIKHSIKSNSIKFDLLFDSAFVHSSIMLRKSLFNVAGGYNPIYKPVEDYEYWTRIASQYEVANIPTILHAYRELPASMIRADPEKNLVPLVKITATAIERLVGASFSAGDIHNLSCLSHRAFGLIVGNVNARSIMSMLDLLANKVFNYTDSYDEQFKSRVRIKKNDILRAIVVHKASIRSPIINRTIRILQIIKSKLINNAQ